MASEAPSTRAESRPARVLIAGLVAGVPVALSVVMGVAYLASAALPPVPVPPENPITESKRQLGKILFWDEQLSTSNAVSCGSCHIPGRAGGDPRLARAAGIDNVLNTPDDIVASPGVVSSDGGNSYLPDPTFGLRVQITSRTSRSAINAAYAPELFWDGRAPSRFVDPQTGVQAIATGGALENQAIAPILNTTEMAHAGLSWAGVAERLGRARPLELATNIPPDIAAAIAANPTYPELFRAAFGDEQITATRIAFAIATYERTLIADQTPWDRFQAGQQNALTPQQVQGMNAFTASNCVVCHAGPLFSDNSFRNVGLRPPAEDTGRQVVTGNPNDRGRFRVPSLRNVGLKASFMHNGQFTSLVDVIRFYARAPGAAPQFPDNRDPVMQNVNVPPQAAVVIQDFIQNGLTDPRVAAQTFPFDKPTLIGERPTDLPSVINAGVAGSGNVVPRVILAGPALLGSREFRVGLDGALGSTTARLAISSQGPVNGRIAPTEVFDALAVGGSGNGAGFATQHWTLSPMKFSPGQVVFAQWIVDDPAAPGGQAWSNVARIPLICGLSGCVTTCRMIDLNFDGGVDLNDFFAFLGAFDTSDDLAEIDGVPGIDLGDFFAFLGGFDSGC